MAQSNEQGGDELRARVLLKMTALALNFRDLVSDDMPSLQESTNDMVQLILADRKQHELEARQSEVESMGILAVDIPELLPPLAKRLDQIKEQREAL